MFVLTAHAQQQTNANGFISLSDAAGNGQQEQSGIPGVFSAKDLGDFVNKLFIFAITIGGFLAVGRIVYAGWMYMMGDSLGGMKRAREIFRDVVIGILILLSIWLILKVINPCILNLNVLQSLSGNTSTCTQ
jgi:hypothetical protein